MKYIRDFNTLTLKDLALVGGKNASLGEMISNLSNKGIEVPNGFAITTQGYWHFIHENNLESPIKNELAKLGNDFSDKKLSAVGKSIRKLFEQSKISTALTKEIEESYKKLSKEYKQQNLDVALRSSATAEDLPTASFAGQQETFLNIRGTENVVKYTKKCMASLFTDRAIVYRIHHNFDHMKVALSVGVQKMVRSDQASAGVAFSLDTESGFKNAVIINSTYGLGESLVKGSVIPDEFTVFKTTLHKNLYPIIAKHCAQKHVKMVYTQNPQKPIKLKEVPLDQQNKFSLTDDEVIHVAQMTCTIEKYYTHEKQQWCPVDVEWAKDGIDGKIYIVQARPETVHASRKYDELIRYKLIKINDTHKKQLLITSGQSIGQKIASGKARLITSATESYLLKEGEILVASMTDPDWVPAMKRAAAIVTLKGGRTCHAAIVSRELGIPAIVGAHNILELINTGDEITIDCSGGATGYVYKTALPFKTTVTKLKELPKLPTKLMLNIATPSSALSSSFLPVSGVGLARIEFIVTNDIKIHPMAIAQPGKIIDPEIQENIKKITAAYSSPEDFFIEKLSQGIGMIAAAFYPKPVIVRLSDFKTNEYRNLIGGIYFEPHEHNPMIGLRGASRYYNKAYQKAFTLECEAFKRVRKTMGLDNVRIMVPFVRTVHEAKSIIKLLSKHGLESGKNGLELIMMCEIPSNALLIDEFCPYFDGFSIGSNDLTQLTLGIDRDSEQLAPLFDERNPAVKKLILMTINGAHKHGCYVGICGQAPSDYPEFAEFLINNLIDSISLNPDAVLPFLLHQKKMAEK